MYAYITCWPDIGYAITTMGKFSTRPSEKNYVLLKGIAKYLCITKHWGIKYLYFVDQDDLDPTKSLSDVVFDKNLSPFPVDIYQPKLIAFVDAAYAND